uniref:Deacetylase sirtuin-type domain-containing protein n=1 Tax=Glycine max TaxID=3847 RepID=C6TLU7_SOYBN|nr:unknown [Glycine max]
MVILRLMKDFGRRILPSQLVISAMELSNLMLSFFGDNVPKDRADMAMEASRRCDAFLVLGSSLMTMSAFRLIRAAHEAGAATAIVNIGVTRADDFVPLKINARLGEILPRVLDIGSISIPAV